MGQSKGVAWYDVKGAGWLRDIYVLLHPPYTAWHLAYIPIAAALVPDLNWAALGWTVLAFFLGMGIAGHCYDELNGRPLRTTLSDAGLGSIAVISLTAAVVIGSFLAMSDTELIIPCIVFGVFIVMAYNLEWPSRKFVVPAGFFHRDEFFGLAWGAFPALTAYVVQAHTLSLASILVALFAYLTSMAQRKLSLNSRFWRRKALGTWGQYCVQIAKGPPPARPITQDGEIIYVKEVDFGKREIIGPVDLSLKYFNGAIIVLAVGLLIMRLIGG